MERLGAKSVDSLLVKLVKHAADTYAQPPISNFRVGVAALGKSGAIYLGANIEFRNTSLGQSVHAEQFAVALMASQGEVGLNSLALTHSPCGHCRQFFQEVYGASGMRVVFPGSPAAVLSDLLPEAFTPSDLHEDPPLVMRGAHACRSTAAKKEPPAKRYNVRCIGNAIGAYANGRVSVFVSSGQGEAASCNSEQPANAP